MGSLAGMVGEGAAGGALLNCLPGRKNGVCCRRSMLVVKMLGTMSRACSEAMLIPPDKSSAEGVLMIAKAMMLTSVGHWTR